jgi:peptide/nickel transport system permease protein
MGQFMLRRTMYAVVTLFILSLTIFTVVRLTGDPVTLLAEPGARAEDLDHVRAEWGLDRSWPVQYLAFAKNVLTGQLGKSFNYEMPVSTLYFQRLPNSLELALTATLIPSLLAYRPESSRRSASTAPGTISARPLHCLVCRSPAFGSGW